ncbi:MAG: hypothetical protein C0397_08015, partial [Odoribacter sp.]|nr:hypothetical protein [Odoribacter sp.]
MNQNLQKISEFLQQDELLSVEEKTSLTKAVADAEKEMEITAFKLDRTEKVKRTTAILLEETIEELEQKRKAVEAQNRELEIEASLERVRAVALSMQNPSEMAEVCRIISEQLEFLKVNNIRNIQTAIINESKGTYINYEYYARHDKLLITEVSYKTHHLQEEFALRMLKGAGEFFSTSLMGQEVKDWYEYQKTTNQFADSFLEEAQTLNYYMFSLGPVALGISTYSPLIEEEINLFKRFRNVFELAYRRFLDIQKAEAQARESQIQLALERVRARTMAMQKSEELSETAFILFQQFKELGEIPIQITIGIIDEAEESIEFRITGSDGTGTQINSAFNASIEEPTLMQKLFKAWKAHNRLVVIELSGKELKGWVNYRNILSGTKDNSDYSDASRVISAGFFSKGLISISTLAPLPDETIQLLERFAGVFDQTYTRFMDLQKAEAQARESQIQLALERVRARTMAMQRSEELSDVAEILFNQVKELGILPWSTGFNIWQEGNESYIDWVTNPTGGFMEPYTVDLTSHPAFREISDAKKRGEEFHAFDVSGESLAETYELLVSFAPRQFEGIRASGIPFPTRVINHYVYGEKIGLMFITLEPCPDAWDIFKRLGKVFEQTYARFLDLQKAEAQAREAQIEAALERVRARTMAMQRTDELQDAASLLFQQVKALGTSSWTCGFQIWDEDKKFLTAWMGTEVELAKFIYPGREDATLRFYEALQRGETLYVEEIGGEAIKAHYDFMKTIPGPREALQHVTDAGFPLPTFQIFHVAYFTQGFLLFITYEHVPEMHDVFKRFAKVFEQTYTRFLDLQKAEAQARESQIQLALERVRARTMAMQKSEELPNAALL